MSSVDPLANLVAQHRQDVLVLARVDATAMDEHARRFVDRHALTVAVENLEFGRHPPVPFTSSGVVWDDRVCVAALSLPVSLVFESWSSDIVVSGVDTDVFVAGRFKRHDAR